MHVKTKHFQERLYPCTICYYTATQASYLSRHTKAVHQKDEQDNMRCTDCDYKTVQWSNLIKHRKILHSDNPTYFSCNICTFQTKHENYLKWHVKRIHQTMI